MDVEESLARNRSRMSGVRAPLGYSHVAHLYREV